MSALFAGIDGGQSSTQAVVGDERGRVLGRGAAGPCDEVGESERSTKLADALDEALAAAARGAGVPEGTHFVSIVAAISGYEGRVHGAPPRLPSDRVSLMHDAPAAHAGALSGSAGVIVIAGTGSVTYARSDMSEERTLGGWGYVFGDEGSGFWLAREALAAMMRAQDAGNASYDQAREAAYDFFGMDSLRAIARGFHTGAISRQRLAAFAPVALRREEFEAIVRAGAVGLGTMACRGLDTYALDRVALCGGLTRDRSYYDAIAHVIATRRPDAAIVPPRYEPVEGALLLAYRKAGLPVRELRA